MSAIVRQFELAQLAEASYTILSSAVYGNKALLAARLTDKKNFSGEFSTTQAAEFVEKYRVVDQYTAPTSFFGQTGTGFSATLFQNIETGRYTFAIRGTEVGVPDLVEADFEGIVVNGVPLFQLVDMYNYWQSLNSSGVYQAAKLELVTAETVELQQRYALRGIDPSAYDAYIAQLQASGRIIYSKIVGAPQVLNVVTGPSNVLLAGTGLAQGSGKVLSGGLLDVVGHSLGGNLATAFTRLFPLVPSNAVTVNGAGFPTGLIPGLGGNATSNIQNLFAALSGSSSFDASKIHNIHGSGPNFITMNSQYGLVQQGSTQEIFIERNDPSVTFGHKATQMTDTLAMYDLFASLDSTLKSATLTAVHTALFNMFKASSAKPSSSHERLLDGLVKFFGLQFPQLTDADLGVSEREDVFKRVIELRKSITTLAAANPGMRIDVLANTDATPLANLAQGSSAYAYRYALKELNPFAIVSDNDLYSNRHNQNRELDLYNPADRPGSTGALTTEWITDRAALLAWKNIAYTQDTLKHSSGVIVQQGAQVTEAIRFTDLAQSLDLGVVPPGGTVAALTDVRRYVFGGDGSDNVVGGVNADRLYGGGGTDYMIGKAGNDYLEGGKGLDIYQFNTTAFALVGSGHDGADVIRDIDGKGVLRMEYRPIQGGLLRSQSTIIADASVKISDTQWKSADGKFVFTKSGADLEITYDPALLLGDLLPTGTITLKNFKNGDFNIHLREPRANPIFVYEYIGDHDPAPGDPTPTDAAGNALRGVYNENRQDTMGDTFYNDRIRMLGGDDTFGGIKRNIYPLPKWDNYLAPDSTHEGDDWVSGGKGRDMIWGGYGDDLLEGGTDETTPISVNNSDIISGDYGNDHIYGDFKVSLADAINAGESDTSLYIKGDYLIGWRGDDWVVATATNDNLIGGDGNDVLVGGAGDDNIHGDIGYVIDDLSWDVQREVRVTGVFVEYHVNTFANLVPLNLDPEATGADVIYGGAGSDWVFAHGGDDFVDAGSGDDVVFGHRGDDVLIGGRGNDLLSGDFGPDDQRDGNDFLDAGDGNDTLVGSGGDDVLIGGAGDDSISGGTGKDIYVFNRGDGNDRIDDPDDIDGSLDAQGQNANKNKSIIVLGDGIDKSQIKFRRGSLLIDAGDGDEMHLHLGEGRSDPAASPVFDHLKFADGSVMTFDDVLAQGFDIDGTEGNDNSEPGEAPNLFGTSVTDRVRGLAGNDLLFGLAGNDMLDAGAGDDFLDGGEGNDTLMGMDGIDGLVGGNGDDSLDGGAGNDDLAGGNGNDTLFGADGVDVLMGDAGDDSLDGGAGDDSLAGGDGNDTLISGDGADTMYGDVGDDLFIINADTSQNFVVDDSGANRIRFGAGITPQNLTLGQVPDANDGTQYLTIGYGGGGQVAIKNGFFAGAMQSYEFADGTILTQAQLLENAPALTLSGGANAETLYGGNQGDTLAGGDGNDTLYGVGGADILNGDAGNDSLLGGLGNDSLTGGADDDLLQGDAGNDTLDGGAGVDVMSGGEGSDTYRFARGSGADSINDIDLTPALTDIDKIEFAADIVPNDVLVKRIANDLELTISGTSDVLRVVDYFAREDAYHRIEQFKFSNGTTWTDSTIQAKVSGGTAGDDTLYGTSAGNILDGQAGNDTIYGLGGNDYLYGRAGADRLAGGAGNDLLFGDVGDDTYVYARGDGIDTLYEEVDTPANVDRIELAADIAPADVTLVRQWTTVAGNKAWTDLLLRVNGQDAIKLPNYLLRADNGLKVEHIVFGDGTIWDAAYVLAAVSNPVTESADTIEGYEFAETIDGRGGDDVIKGFSGDDQLLGSAGNDTLDGNLGNDTLDGGSGADVLSGNQGNDSLIGGAGNDELNGDTYEGTLGTTQPGGNDTLHGGSGDDLLRGAKGDDVYRFGRGDGSDVIAEYENIVPNSQDKILLAAGITPGDVTLLRDGNDLLLALDGSATQIRISKFYLTNVDAKIELIEFADGTIWDAAGIQSRIVTGTANSMTGTVGNDTFVVDNAGDTITEAVGGGTDTVQSSVSYALGANLENLTLTGHFGVNATGNTLSNTLIGNIGNNMLDGQGGGDVMQGGAGDDTYVVTYGYNDSVIEAPNAGIDTVLTTFSYTLPDNVEIVRISGSSHPSGSAYLTGNSLDNILDGSGGYSARGNTIMDGGLGADIMIGRGNVGDVFYVDNPGDVVQEVGAFDQYDDLIYSSVSYTLPFAIEQLTLIGTSAIAGYGNTKNNIIRADQNANANTLVGGAGDDTYYVGANDSVIENANEGTDLIELTSGNNVTLDLNAMASVENAQLNNAVGESNIVGSNLANILRGNNSVNTLWGGDGNDTLYGGGGNDTMEGGSGDDQFFESSIGGASPRSSGSDTYLFGRGAGQDVISDSDTYASTDTIQFTADVQATDVVLSRAASTLPGGDNLVVQIAGTTDQITVDYHFYNRVGNNFAQYGIEQLRFGDGTIWNAAAIEARRTNGNANTLTENADVYVGSGSADSLNLLGGDDVASGGLGADVIDGGLGADMLFGNDGDDQLTGDAGADQLFGGTGADTLHGGAEADLLYGEEGDDSLLGGASNDRLEGGAGNDVLAGGTENDQLYGDEGGDTLAGDDGDDTLTGGTGDDRLAGGAGFDQLNGNDGSDTYVFARGDGQDTVYETVSGVTDTYVDTVELAAGILTGDVTVSRLASDLMLTINGTSDRLTVANFFADPMFEIEQVRFADGTIWTNAQLKDMALVMRGTDAAETLSGTESDDRIFGLAGNDTINGLGGNDVIDGGTGNDSMRGGLGDDTYIVDSTSDTVTENANEGFDVVESSATFTLGSNVENLTLTGTAAINGTGNTLNNVITGNSNNNTLSGGTGADTMIGGAGNDTYVVDNAGDVVTENANEGTDLVQAGVTYTLGANLENLTLTGTGAINGSGNALDNTLAGNSANNTLTGGDGNDTLNGGAGSDSMAGGLGNDTYVVDATGDSIAEAANQGTDSVQSSVTYTLGNNVENLTLTGTTAINGTGNALANVLIGNSANNTLTGGDGNDTLNGGAGTDTLVGGLGDDTYILDIAVDTITESAGQGTDTVQASVTYTLATNVENLVLTGTGNINGTGNTANNVITGNAGNNTLSGGTGADTMAGGAGNDIYVVDVAGDVVTENLNEGTDLVQAGVTYTLGANIENLTLTGTTAINGTGNALDNVLTGNSTNNTLTGGDGNDTLDGGAGSDSMVGGLGNDTYVVNVTGDVVNEAANQGTDTVQSSITYTLGTNVENLTLTGSTTINGTGNALDNVLTGNSGTNALTGLGGNDIYFINGSDTVVEAASAGEDLVNSAVTHTLATNVEHLILTGTTALNGTGNTLNNLLRGNTAINTLAGGAGNDMLEGGDGNDILGDTAGNNYLNGQAGSDTLTGNTGKELFIGGRDNDAITTNTGADIIAFNRGDGGDTVAASTTQDNTVSLGGGITYADLYFQKSGNNLVLKTAGSAASEGLTFTDWYTATSNRSVLNLQVVAQASADFDAGSADPTRNKKVAQFNFAGLVNQFDAAVTANPTITTWALSNALAAFHIGGSDTAAIGGDLGYQYGMFGNLANVGTVGAQNVMADAQFGSGLQSFQTVANLQSGVTKLS